MIATITEAVLSGVISGAVAGGLAGAAVSVRMIRKTRSRTSGDRSPIANVDRGAAVIAGDNAQITQSFQPPPAPDPVLNPKPDRSAWAQQARSAASQAAQAYAVLRHGELPIQAAVGRVDPEEVNRTMMEAENELHVAALGAPDEELYQLLDTMERRLRGAANGFAFVHNYVVTHPAVLHDEAGRKRIVDGFETGLAKLENGDFTGGIWTDGLSWVELEGELRQRLNDL